MVISTISTYDRIQQENQEQQQQLRDCRCWVSSCKPSNCARLIIVTSFPSILVTFSIVYLLCLF